MKVSLKTEEGLENTPLPRYERSVGFLDRK